MQLELPLQSNSGHHLTPWLPIPKTTTIINSQDPRSTYPPLCVAAFGGLKKFKMATVAMVTKVQKMLNSLRTADPFETSADSDFVWLISFH
jgi:hypothetical protein